MSDDLQSRTEQRARQIWEREGRPDGRADEHWRLAAEEISREDEEAAAKKAAEEAAAKKAADELAARKAAEEAAAKKAAEEAAAKKATKEFAAKKKPAAKPASPEAKKPSTKKKG